MLAVRRRVLLALLAQAYLLLQAESLAVLAQQALLGQLVRLRARQELLLVHLLVLAQALARQVPQLVRVRVLVLAQEQVRRQAQLELALELVPV